MIEKSSIQKYAVQTRRRVVYIIAITFFGCEYVWYTIQSSLIHGRGPDRAAYKACLNLSWGEILIQQAVLPGHSLSEYICIACHCKKYELPLGHVPDEQPGRC